MLQNINPTNYVIPDFLQIKPSFSLHCLSSHCPTVVTMAAHSSFSSAPFGWSEKKLMYWKGGSRLLMIISCQNNTRNWQMFHQKGEQLLKQRFGSPTDIHWKKLSSHPENSTSCPRLKLYILSYRISIWSLSDNLLDS